MSIELEATVKVKADSSEIKKTSEQLGNTLGDSLTKSVDKSVSSFVTGAGKSISSGIGQSLLDSVTTGFDNISGVWDSAWTSLAKSAKSILADGLGSLALGSLGFTSGGKGLTEAISDAIAAYKMSDSFTEALAAGNC
jgi:hypothetical protein